MSGALEPPRRLSESIVWELQRAYYAREGDQAWKGRGLPFWMTSNVFFARAWAGVVLGFLRDLSGGSAGVSLDRAAPLHVVELAGGSGQFAFSFLRRLRQLQGAVPELAGLRLRYVLTDFAESNLRAWEAHEGFRALLDEGALDFAVFDLERDTGLRLLRSGERLQPGEVANPMVVVASYAFDSTRQDCFRVREGTLYEDRVSAAVPAGGPPADPSDPGLLERIVALDHHPQPVAGPYYGDARLDGLLESYRRRLRESVFLLPISALRCADRLLQLSGGRLLLLCADKGISREEDLEGRGEPTMARQAGCFSFTVNLHALGRFFEEAGGRVFHLSDPRPPLQVSAFVGRFPGRLPETRQAYLDHVDGFGPGEFYTLASSLCEQRQPATLEVILALLELSGFDGEIAYSFRDALRRLAREATPVQKRKLRRALAAVAEAFYPLQKDLFFELARIALAMAAPEEAAGYCRRSLRLFGDNAEVLLMLAYACTLQGQDEQAAGHAERALALRPGLARARELLERLRRT